MKKKIIANDKTFENIKNIFIFGAMLLIILTLAIAVSYAYFYDKQENSIANTTVYEPYLSYNSQVIANTNGQQKDIYITNNSENVLSYNISYKNTNHIYYKIIDENYYPPTGTINPSENIKIRLVSLEKNIFDKSDEELGFSFDSDYQFMTSINSFNNLNISKLSSVSEINNITTSYGNIKKLDDKTYKITVENDINSINLNINVSNNGYTNFNNFNNLKIGDNEKFISLYAEDGTYIDKYTINIHKKDIPYGIISNFKTYNDENKENRVKDIKDIKDDSIDLDYDETDKYFTWNYTDNEDYCSSSESCRYCVRINDGEITCNKENKIEIKDRDKYKIEVIDSLDNSIIYNTYNLNLKKVKVDNTNE